MATKQKIQLEYPVHSSPKILFNYISTAQGLADWFADEVTVSNGIFEFKWGDETAHAKMVHKREGQLVTFKWLDEPGNYEMQIEIMKDELTNDVSLLITDYCHPEDKEETRMLWDSQIHNLKHIIGS